MSFFSNIAKLVFTPIQAIAKPISVAIAKGLEKTSILTVPKGTAQAIKSKSAFTLAGETSRTTGGQILGTAIGGVASVIAVATAPLITAFPIASALTVNALAPDVVGMVLKSESATKVAGAGLIAGLPGALIVGTSEGTSLLTTLLQSAGEQIKPIAEGVGTAIQENAGLIAQGVGATALVGGALALAPSIGSFIPNFSGAPTGSTTLPATGVGEIPGQINPIPANISPEGVETTKKRSRSRSKPLQQRISQRVEVNVANKRYINISRLEKERLTQYN